jgi:hypothetical protein
MTNTFSTTGGTSHSQLITGLSNANIYNYYVRCADTVGNKNTNDYIISFSVASVTAPCSLTSVSISANCGGDGLCSQGETITMSGTYTGDCSAADFFQIDAVSADGACNIQYNGASMRGIWDSSITLSGGTISGGSWVIPSIPSNCLGKTLSATAGALYHGGAPGTGTLINGISASGSFTFTFTTGGLVIPKFGISEAMPDWGGSRTYPRTWSMWLRQLDEDVAVGAQYIRFMVDPGWGQSILDIVASIEAKGLAVMAILTPGVNPKGEGGNAYVSPAAAADYMSATANFLSTNNVWIYEFENEVNNPESGWSTMGPTHNTGSARDGGYNYGLAAMATYARLKSINPNAIFVIGALGGTQPYDEWTLNWIRGIYDSGCSWKKRNCFDYFSLHLYCDPDDWNNDWATPMWYKTQWHSSTVKSVMEEEYGDYGVPIISTESGESSSFPTSDKGPAGGHNAYWSEATQARIYGHVFDHIFGIAHAAGSDAGGPWQAYDGVSAPWASFCAFTMPDDSMANEVGWNHPDGFGLIRLDYTHKPSWQVYQTRVAQGH